MFAGLTGKNASRLEAGPAVLMLFYWFHDTTISDVEGTLQ